MDKRLVALLCLLLLAGSPARAEDAPPDVGVPAGMPIQLDGSVGTAEWSAARLLRVGERGSVLRLMQFRGTLLLAFTAPDAWTEGDELLLTFAPDAAAKDLGAWTDGAVSIRFEPLKHDRAHLIVSRMQGTTAERQTAKVLARARLDAYACSVELALRLDFLGLTPGQEQPLRFHCIRARPGAPPPTSTWPVGLDVGARANAHPPDMRSAARWGRLTGLTQAGGPGAISKTDWTRLREQQDEITRRGREAHALLHEMVEEQRSYQKQETLVDAQIFGNLAWIAEREPLADVDRLLMAKAHRRVNRHAEALAVLDALVGASRSATRSQALYERALTLHEMQAFEEEAATWERLASSTTQRLARTQYEGQARRAREFQAAWVAEAAAHAEDERRVDLPLVEIVTNRGTFLIRLLADDTPKAAAHFLALVRSGFYDGLRFHRVLAGNLTQCGDPTTRDGDCSLAGSGESDRKVDVEENKRRKPWRGAVAFARKRGLYANASQFFITTGPRPQLVDDSRIPYTLFGWIAAGMDVVDRLEWCDTLVRARVLFAPPAQGGPEPGKPTEGVRKDGEK